MEYWTVYFFLSHSTYVRSHLPAVELYKTCRSQYQAKLATLKGEELAGWMQELENESAQVGGGSFEHGRAARRVVDIQGELVALVCPP